MSLGNRIAPLALGVCAFVPQNVSRHTKNCCIKTCFISLTYTKYIQTKTHTFIEYLQGVRTGQITPFLFTISGSHTFLDCLHYIARYLHFAHTHTDCRFSYTVTVIHSHHMMNIFLSFFPQYYRWHMLHSVGTW